MRQGCRLLLGCVLCLAWLTRFAAAEPDPDLEAKVQARLEALVAEALEPRVRAACEQLAIPYPPVKATLTLAEVEQKLEAAALAALAGKLPADDLEAGYREEAAKAYRLYEKGEKITITFLSGTKLEGTLIDATTYWVNVSGRRVAKTDLSDETLAHFDEALSRKLQEMEVRRRLNRDKVQREKLLREKREELAPAVYREHGYVPWRGQWVSAVVLIETSFAAQYTEARRTLREQAENQVYLPLNYKKEEGEWRPLAEVQAQREAERLAAAEADAARQARLAEEARLRAEEDARLRAEAAAAEARRLAEKAAAAANPALTDGEPGAEPGLEPPPMPTPDDPGLPPPEDGLVDPFANAPAPTPEPGSEAAPVPPVEEPVAAPEPEPVAAAATAPVAAGGPPTWMLTAVGILALAAIAVFILGIRAFRQGRKRLHEAPRESASEE